MLRCSAIYARLLAGDKSPGIRTLTRNQHLTQKRPKGDNQDTHEEGNEKNCE